MQRLCARLLAFLILTKISVFAADEGKSVTLSDTPVAVQKAIAARVGDGKVDDIERSFVNGETVFEVDFTARSGGEQDFTVADDGTVLSVGVTLAETPAPVQKTIQALTRGWEIEGINKNIADSEISFDVTIAKAGIERTINVMDNGTLSSVGVGLAETPAAVQTTIKSQLGDGKVQYIEQDLDPAENSFDVEATAKDGSRKSFSVAPSGQLLSEEVTLEQVPPPARRTIQEKIGNGKIVRIDKSLSERRGNVLPYEVQGRKDGRPFDFSVGPHGRFLGMDE